MKPGCTLIAYLHAKPEKRDELLKILQSFVKPSRAEAACVEYHLHVSNDDPNLFVFYENWRIVKTLWTQPSASIPGEFWQIPPDMEWRFAPTRDFAAHTLDQNNRLREIGIVPRPLQQPHPPVYAPFSYSMETVRFWGREGGKLVSFVSTEKEHFTPNPDRELSESRGVSRASSWRAGRGRDWRSSRAWQKQRGKRRYQAGFSGAVQLRL